MADRYAVIGNPIGHTKSPLIHGLFAEATGQEMDYGAIEGQPGQFAGALDAFRQAGGKGINITAPFKLDAYAYASEHSPAARLAGAANALKFEGQRVLAQNFDGIGLLRDIEHNLGVALRGRQVLLLGAGGAVRGALLPFLEAQPARLLLVNRHGAKAQDLLQAVGAAAPPVFEAGGYGELAGQRFDVIVNATSASLRAEPLPLPDEVFSKAVLAYELAYGKGLTPFLAQAGRCGVPQLADGVGMLVEQAAEAFAWWRGVRPETAPVIERLRVPLI